MSASNVRRQLDPAVWDEYFKFTVVRNPFDKLISGFFHFQETRREPGRLERIGGALSKRAGGKSPLRLPFAGGEVRRFRAWLRSFSELVAENQSLTEAVDVPHYEKPMQLSLIDRDKYLIDGTECVDDFLRFETLGEEIRRVCERLDVPYEPESLPEFKKGGRRHSVPVREFYDPPSRKIVEDLYAWELARFGYDVPD
jgi:hypothetical protein